MIRLAANYPTQSTGRAIDYEAINKNVCLDQGIAIIDLTDSSIPWQDRENYQGNVPAVWATTGRAAMIRSTAADPAGYS